MLLCFQVTTSQKQLFFMFILTSWLRCWQKAGKAWIHWSCCTHTHCVTELCVLGGLDIRGPLWNYLPVLGIPVEQLLFCLGFSLPGNPRHVVSTAEGWGASGRREMYPSQSQNLVSLFLFLWYIFWKCLGKDTGDMDGDEKLLRYWKM